MTVECITEFRLGPYKKANTSWHLLFSLVVCHSQCVCEKNPAGVVFPCAAVVVVSCVESHENSNAKNRREKGWRLLAFVWILPGVVRDTFRTLAKTSSVIQKIV